MADEEEAAKSWRALLKILKTNEGVDVETADDIVSHIKSLKSLKDELTKSKELSDERLAFIKTENEQLKKENESKLARIQKFEAAAISSHIAIDGHYKEAYETLTKHFDEVTKQRDQYTGECEHLRSELRKSQLMVDQQSKMLDVARQNNNTGNQSRTVNGARAVTLEKRDDNGKYGVRFGVKGGQPLLNASRIVVVYVNNDLVPRDLVRIDDYVIEINNQNVQGATMSDVKELCAGVEDRLVLSLKSPNRNVEEFVVDHTGGETFEQYGLTFCVKVKHIVPNKMAARTLRIHEGDEIVQVNDRNIPTLSIEQVERKFCKAFKLKIQRPCKLESENASDIQSEGSELSLPYVPRGTSSPPPPPPINTANHPVLIKHERQRTSVSTVDAPDITTQISVDSEDQSVSPGAERPHQNAGGNAIYVTIRKKDYESIGLKIIGGNMIGIYVSSVEQWSPALRAEVKVGWKLLEINHFILSNVAWYYAMEVIQLFNKSEVIDMKFEKCSEEDYKKAIARTPFDSFHVEALKDYPDKQTKRVLFKKGEVIRVTNSSQGVWTATRINSNDSETILIPPMPSIRFGNIDTTKKEHVYEEIDDNPPAPGKSEKNVIAKLLRKGSSGNGNNRLYKLLDNVEVTLQGEERRNSHFS